MWPAHKAVLSVSTRKAEGIRCAINPQLVAIAILAIINLLCCCILHPLLINELPTIPIAILQVQHTQAKIIFCAGCDTRRRMQPATESHPAEMLQIAANWLQYAFR